MVSLFQGPAVSKPGAGPDLGKSARERASTNILFLGELPDGGRVRGGSHRRTAIRGLRLDQQDDRRESALCLVRDVQGEGRRLDAGAPLMGPALRKRLKRGAAGLTFSAR